MKADITAEGDLIITPDSTVEAFALSQWDSSKHTITIIKEWPIPEPYKGSAH